MQCQILFSGKNKKNISKCRLLKILPRVLSVKQTDIIGNISAKSEDSYGAENGLMGSPFNLSPKRTLNCAFYVYYEVIMYI